MHKADNAPKELDNQISQKEASSTTPTTP